MPLQQRTNLVTYRLDGLLTRVGRLLGAKSPAAILYTCCLLISATGLAGQSAGPKPEYYGFYALDGGKLIVVGDGKSETPPDLRQVKMAVLEFPEGVPRTVVHLATGTHFLLYDVAPAEAGRAISIYRLPFVHNEWTIPDTMFGKPTVRERNLPGVMRLAQSQIRVLQKPMPSQPQMLELVPDPPLTPGLYGVLFAPASGVAVGGPGAGQVAGWTSMLLIGDFREAERSGQCIDLKIVGGLGGMLGIDSPDRGRIASFPLLDPRRASACSLAPGSSASSVVAPTLPTKRSNLNLADLERTIAAGKEVTFPVKYNNIGPGEKRATGYLCPEGGSAVGMSDGVLVLSKTSVAFSAECRINRGFGRTENCDFRVSPDNIFELENQSEMSARLHLKVVVKRAKGNKEDKKDYYFYHAGTHEEGACAVGGPGSSLACNGCDDTMDILFALLNRLRVTGGAQ